MAITIAFAIVPRPGRSLSGIQTRSTKILIMKVVMPISSPVFAVRPWAKTVHGPTPRSAITSKASPVPNSHRPPIRIASVLGLELQRESERQRVTDDVQGRIVRDGNFVSVQWKRKGDANSIDDAPVVRTNLTGTYNLPNIMAAVATGIVFGLTDEEIANGISSYQPSNNRSEVKKKGSNTFILDAYNANPSSMEVAITNLISSDGENHSVILGEMLEVGESSDEEHRNICTRLQLLPIKSVCLVGKEFQQFKNEFGFNFFLTVDELNEWLKNNPFENETVLIKGSRGNRLEKAAELLLA